LPDEDGIGRFPQAANYICLDPYPRPGERPELLALSWELLEFLPTADWDIRIFLSAKIKPN
jgi:hypothetical protein